MTQKQHAVVILYVKYLLLFNAYLITSLGRGLPRMSFTSLHFLSRVFSQACLEMNDYEKAEDYLTMAQAKKPFDTDINNLLRKLAK